MKALLATKLRNELLALKPDLQVQLRNAAVNGVKMGCTGFITDPATGQVVYVDTDHNHGTSFDHACYRTACDTKDYRGGTNHFSDYASLTRNAVALLGDQDACRPPAVGRLEEGRRL